MIDWFERAWVGSGVLGHVVGVGKVVAIFLFHHFSLEYIIEFPLIYTCA